MKRILVMASDLLLANAIASRLAEETSPDSVHVTHHEIDQRPLSDLKRSSAGQKGREYCNFLSVSNDGKGYVILLFTS